MPVNSDRLTDLFGLPDKVAVVTGGSRGIGAMIAGGLLDAGARVYISGRKAEACQAAAEELSGRGECVAVPGDISTPEGCRALADELAHREPRVHVLVNNAGSTWGAPLDEYPVDGWDKVIDTNVRGVFLLTQALLPSLRAGASADDPARVINIGSIDGLRVPTMESYAYSASKAAVHMLTRHLASALRGDPITVNAIAPGPFESKMMAFVLDDPDSRQLVADSIPLGRIGRPDDMAGTAVWLASRAGSYLTGAVIPVGGGAESL